MPPTAEVVVFLRGVHRVVHQHARVAHELDEPAAPLLPRVVLGTRSQLVVRDVHKRPTAVMLLGESVPKGSTRMTDLIGADFVTVSLTALFGHLGEVDRRVQLLECHRKDHGRHLVLDDAADVRLEGFRAPDCEVVSALKDGTKEGNALDVVPMGVGEEDVAGDGRAVGAGDERASELANAGSSIKDDEPSLGGPQLHAGRIAPVADRVAPRRRDRAPRPPKL